VSDSDHGEQEELALWMLSTAWKHDLDHDLTSPLGMFAVHPLRVSATMTDRAPSRSISTSAPHVAKRLTCTRLGDVIHHEDEGHEPIASAS
jgi:hypothetical protein